MAEVVAISLQVDGGNSYKQIKKLEDGISDLIDETNELNETNIQFKKELQELTNTYNELPKSQLAARSQVKKQMEELKFAIKDNNIALQEFRIKKQQKQKMVNDLKGIQKEAKKTAQELGNIAEGVGHGYKAFLGVTTALGGSNDKLIEAYVKLESVTKGLEGFEKLRKMGLKDSAFLTSALSVKTKVLTGAQKAYSLAVGTSTKAMKGLRTALLATGVGAIIAGLGTIVAYWDDIKGAVSGLSSEQKKRNADLEKEKELTQSNLDNIEATENTLRLAGKSEEDILKMKLEQYDVQIEQQRQTIENAKLQKDTQIKASKRNRDIAQGIIRFLTLPITLLLGTVDALTKAISYIPGIDIETNLEEGFSGGIAEMLFDPEEVEEEADETIAEAEKKLAELQNKRDGFTLAEQQKRKKASEKAIADKKKEDEKLAKLEEEKLAKLKELKEEFTDLQNQEIEDENQRAITQLETEQQRELDALRKKYGENTELEKQLKINQALEMDALEEEQRLAKEEKLKENQAIINEILKQFDLESIENTFEKARKELEIQKNLDLEKLKLAGATQEEIDKLNNVYSEKSKKIAEEELDFKKKLKKQEVDQALKATSDVLGSIVSLVGEGSKVGKAAAIAQATIDTYTAANAAYSSVVGVPVVGPVLAPIAAGVAVASGLANIRKIISTKTPGGGMSGGSGVSAPSIPSVPTTVTSGTAPAGNNTGNGRTEIPTTKVVLVESELQAMQSRRMQVDTIATI